MGEQEIWESGRVFVWISSMRWVRHQDRASSGSEGTGEGVFNTDEVVTARRAQQGTQEIQDRN